MSSTIGAHVTRESKQAGAELQRRMLGVVPSDHDPSTAPGFIAGFIEEHIFGELWQRPGIDLRTRSLCTIAAIVAGGYRDDALKNHVLGALANGATQEEILEVIVHTAVYAGLPLLGGSLRAAQEVFDGRWAAQLAGK
jgi:4-carboxymuconolactone decarboxylase